MADEVIAGRYRLLTPLGRGSMSSVWEAEDGELARRVAVKMLAPSAERRRFEREARAAAALSHPNIVSLYDYGEADGRPYMVLELLPRGSLEERLGDGRPLRDEETMRIARDVAAGLAHAHERGLVHRDLKPANILFDAEERAKIADFGIARMRGTGTLTEAGTVLGTASYLSPEQASGEPAGAASDVYSFGVILFRLLTGRLPFVSRNAMELVRMHREEPPPAVRELRPDAAPALAALASAALAKDPAARPRDGAALLAALDGDDTAATVVVPPSEAEATRAFRPSPPPRARRRRGVLVVGALAGCLVAGVAAALALTLGGGNGTPATTTLPSLSLPTVPSTATQPVTTFPTTSAPTQETTTAPTTTAQTTASLPTTTAAPATTAPPTTTAPATTVVPPTTTAPVTTGPVTTDTTPATTTAP